MVRIIKLHKSEYICDISQYDLQVLYVKISRRINFPNERFDLAYLRIKPQRKQCSKFCLSILSKLWIVKKRLCFNETFLWIFQAKRTKKVGVVGKYGTRYGASLRKTVKKMEITQHSKYYCHFCGKVRPQSSIFKWPKNLSENASF